ncbi:hypothetical protein CBLAS_1471 [Campylobacter blaseri]|uniref:Diaminopimelate epimerase n=1 Tax=Campylobacter blaseri TaxID=2042961 RepID=A0A2P8QZ71_9BACT|nr:hypothetical protein [Campylobacter blaseri]PSM51546.1 hypothetical protein CQ405_07050 [Campylobacter blaseri]PSM53339.1 hypothetical protein CRN67_07055 [Campylobacter blaseri]QKF86632.1 hypothetical protein CBLAS_1471 [Campylobacter blaseri]
MKYHIFIPSGNPTALVVDGLYDNDERKKINDEIMLKHNFVEQVGFLDKNFHLVMAGDEQCLNAIRCAGYYYAKKLNLDEVTIKNCGKSFICYKFGNYVGVKSNIKVDIETIDEDLTKVKLDGITHLVYENDMFGFDEEYMKNFAFKKLKDQNLISEAASGVMVFYKNTLLPVVFVRDINTLFYESACGSGSLACALVEFNKTKQDLSLEIKQPSGENLNISIDNYSNGYCNYTIYGKIGEYIV